MLVNPQERLNRLTENWWEGRLKPGDGRRILFINVR